jgi:hypothetical protein
MNDVWYVTTALQHEGLAGLLPFAQLRPIDDQPATFGQYFSQVGAFLPNLLAALAILIVGWLIATVIASVVQGLLRRTNLDNRLAASITGRPEDAANIAVEKWISAAIFWIIMAFVLVAFLNALNLQVVSTPLNGFLQQIFNYLPRLGGAALLLLVAWAVASVAKLILTRGLARFNLDNRLAAQTGNQTSPFLLSETLGNALYWFIFLFFLPIILDALELQGPLQPVQNLLNDILTFLPNIIYAIVIAAVGWLIARIVRGIVTNLLAAVGTDQIGTRIGLTQARGGLSLSALIGTIVYVLILIPTAIAALNALQIEAISAPATDMLQEFLLALPRVFTAALILAVFYVIGRFIADLVANILTSVGFNNIFSWLGLPPSVVRAAPPTDLSPPPSSISDIPPTSGTPTTIQPTPSVPARTPSEIAGIVVLVGIMLFGAVAATEVLGFEVLTVIVNGILRVSAQVLSGLIVFGIGLYLAALAYNLISSSGGRQARILAQVARIAIIALVTAMALQQMGIASSIVNLAFGLLVGAIAVAIAIAFGLGGRDVASEQLRDWVSSFRQQRP